MAYGIVHTFPGGTKDQYEATFAALHESLDQRPEGQVIHAAGPSPAGWMITAVFDSQEVWEQFRDKTLMPTLKSGIEGGFKTPPVEQTFEVHNLLV